VFVHGSGPSDPDEKIGPNRPFRDIAQGLASRGIASLRYDKRTLAHRAEMARVIASITVDDEFVVDAARAVRFLEQRPEIDPKCVFVIGHSQGGTMAPRIFHAEPSIAGLVLLAGGAVPLEEAYLRQVRYLTALAGNPKQGTDEIEKIERQIKRLHDPGLSINTPAAELPLELPARYWLDLRSYDPIASATSVGRPFLILQGGRDYQVTLDDYNRWNGALGKRTNVTSKLYPALNHLFIAGEGKPSPEEYRQAGFVAPEVVADIVTFVLGSDY
jgi:dienelactone hydrolase